MRRFISLVASAALSFLPASATLGSVQVSNQDEVLDASAVILPGQAYGAKFVTGPIFGWRLNSITVEFASFSNYRLDLYAASSDGVLGQLIATTPTQHGAPGTVPLKFSFGGLELQPLTTYIVVAESTTNLGFVAATTSNFETSPSGWTIDDASFQVAPGPRFIPYDAAMRMTIDADPFELPLEITSVSGCYDAASGAVDCPNDGGGITLVVRDQAFSQETVVVVAGVPMTTTFVSTTELHCALPAGAGRSLPVAVVRSPDSAVLLAALSYADPACIGDADGNGVVNFEDITGVLANFNGTCP